MNYVASKRVSVYLAIAVALRGIGFAAAAPVINEIMYRPGSTYPENTALEFIEIHNPDAAAVDLSGWAITAGPDYTFPTGTVIAAGGYLVVAADTNALAAATGLSGILGPWTAGAMLADRGEKITLSMPDGEGGWTTADRISYADEGDWAVRTRDSLGGWSWITQANGGGCSVERRNPALRVNSGQNWTVSATVGGTPGAANGAVTANIAPVIADVQHSPAVPTSSDVVTISCRLADESAASALSATLYWRDATGTSPGAFNTLAMTGDGTGHFAATLDAKANKTIIEFYVSATDGTLSRTWPAPTSEGQNANCAYQVDNEVLGGTAPCYRLVLTAAENAAFVSLASSNPQSDRTFSLTLVVTRGDDATIRYRTSMRLRGNSSRQYSIKSLRISMPSDDRWDGVSDFMINARGAPGQHLAHRIQRAAGLVAADTTGIELRRQGVEYTTSSLPEADFGQLVRVEEINGDYIDNHWPDAVSGQVYRKTGVSSWSSNGAAPDTPDGTWNGWDKQSSHAVNAWSDVIAFCSNWQSVAYSHFTGATVGNVAAGTWNKVAFTDAETATLETVADLDYLARWLAVMTIMPNNEPSLSTGEDDDYAGAFISSGAAARFYPVPHDMDSTFGLGEMTYAYNISGLYDITETDTTAQRNSRPGTGGVTLMEPLLPLLGDSTTAGNAAFRARYLLAIRELFGSVFDADTSTNAYPPFYQFVDNHIGWVPAATRTTIKTFMTNRQNYLLGLIGAGKIAPAAGTSDGGTYTNAPSGALRINEVLALNTNTHAVGTLYPDLVELYNAGSSAVDLSGHTLADDEGHTYTFPVGSVLASNAFLLLTSLTLDFGLDTDGDSVILSDASGHILDSVAYGSQLADRSISRLSTDADVWGLTLPTPAGANGAALSLGSPAVLKLNEWAGNIDFRLPEDFVEVCNPTASIVTLGGLVITDDLLTYPTRFTFPALSFIGASGFTAVWTEKLGFSLDGQFEHIWLLGANGAMMDHADIVSQYADHATGRLPDGNTAAAWSDFALPTPGLSNATSTGRYSNLLSYLRITEVMYAPAGGNTFEFVEMQNISGSVTLDLSGVRFTQSVDYVFPAGTTLAPGAFIVVCKNRSAYLSRYTTPAAVNALAAGNYTGSLDDGGETIALTLPFPWLINIHTFDYDSDWYPLTATSGYSLSTRSQATTAARLWGESTTWSASSAPNGSPGTDEPPVITSGTTASGVVGSAFSYLIAATKTPTGFDAVGLPDGLSVSAFSGLISGTPTVAGTYNVALTASNGAATASATLTLTIAAFGALDHFTWDYVPASVIAGQAFAVLLTARDAGGRVVGSGSGPAAMAASTVSGSAGSPILITELTDEMEDQFELQNVTSEAVDTTGWFVIIGDSTASVSARNAVTFTLSSSMGAGALLRVSESSAQGRVYFGSAINWSSSGTSKGWIMLFDSTSTLRDFVAFGWTAAELANLSLAVNTKTIAPIALGQWTGNGLAVGTRGGRQTDSWRRTGASDSDSLADWAWSQNAASFGTSNPGLSLPWVTTVALTVTPVSSALATGQFLGYVSIAEAASNATLSVSDGSGHTGVSSGLTILSGADTDGDGMPDVWEDGCGLAPGVDDADLDADGDGMSNLEEYWAGTLPDSPASRLAIAEAAVVPSGRFAIVWTGVAGRLYRIRCTDALGGWPLTSGLVLATTSGLQTTAIDVGDAMTRFVRVEVEAAP